MKNFLVLVVVLLSLFSSANNVLAVLFEDPLGDYRGYVSNTVINMNVGDVFSVEIESDNLGINIVFSYIDLGENQSYDWHRVAGAFAFDLDRDFHTGGLTVSFPFPESEPFEGVDLMAHFEYARYSYHSWNNRDDLSLKDPSFNNGDYYPVSGHSFFENYASFSVFLPAGMLVTVGGTEWNPDGVSYSASQGFKFAASITNYYGDWGGPNEVQTSDLVGPFDVVPVPEPSTILLLGIGLLGLVAIKSRKQKS